jgi:hypothetical protein
MTNILRDTLDNIHRRFYTRLWVFILYLVGYGLLWTISWRVALGVSIIHLARDARL